MACSVSRSPGSWQGQKDRFPRLIGSKGTHVKDNIFSSEKGKCFFIEECYLINVEGMKGLRNHYFTILSEMIDSSTDQQMVKL